MHDTDTQAVHYQWQGSGTPVMLIHGLGSSTEDWELQVPALCDRYRVLLVDLPGHGRSPAAPLPHCIDEYAARLSALLTGEGVASAHVVGISLGAMVALQLAADHAVQVKSVVAVNCPLDMRPTTWRLKALVLQRKLLVRLLGMRRLGALLSARLLPGDRFKERRKLFARRWARNDPQQYRAALKAALNWHIDHRLHDITAPLLVIAASEDYTPIEAKRALATGAAEGRLEIVEDSRHAIPVEHPATFNRLLLDFLDQVEAGHDRE